MLSNKLIIASNNKGKIAEIKAMLPACFSGALSLTEAGLNLVSEETGETFLENALIKAREAYAALGVPVIADDSGLCVAALNGAPGVYSARYAGERANDRENNSALLRALSGLKNRDAYFKSVIVLYLGPENYLVGEGETHGSILEEAEGGGGFGYDPLFFSSELNKSFGLATPEEKNRISHRAKALADLSGKIKKAGLY